MDYNFDLDDDKYLFADEILSWIEDERSNDDDEDLELSFDEKSTILIKITEGVLAIVASTPSVIFVKKQVGETGYCEMMSLTSVPPPTLIIEFLSRI